MLTEVPRGIPQCFQVNTFKAFTNASCQVITVSLFLTRVDIMDQRKNEKTSDKRLQLPTLCYLRRTPSHGSMASHREGPYSIPGKPTWICSVQNGNRTD